MIPSLPSPTEDIMKSVASIVKKMDQLPLEEIGSDLQGTTAGINKLVNSPKLQNIVHTLNEILKDLKVTTKTLNSQTVPQVNKNIAEMEKLIKDMDSWVDEDSPLYYDLRKTLDEFSRAAQSISDLADMLERHPEALIQEKTMRLDNEAKNEISFCIYPVYFNTWSRLHRQKSQSQLLYPLLHDKW